MTVAEMRARAQELLDQAKSIQAQADEAGTDITEEQDAQIHALLAERKELLAKAQRKAHLLDEFAVADAEAQTSANEPITPTTLRPDNADITPTIPTSAAQPRDRDAERRHGFRSLGEFAMSTFLANPQAAQRLGRQAAQDQRLQLYADTATTGMSVAVGADGGFLVPPEFSQAIWDEMNAGTDSLLSMTDQHQIVGESMTFNANAETSRVTGSRYGGIQGYWMKEAEQFTASKPTLRQLTLEPEDIGVFVRVTNKLLGSTAGPTLSTFLQRAAADEIRFLTGDAIVNGSGVGKPLGLLNCGCLVTVAEEASQAADTIVKQNLDKMWARLHVRSRPTAVWLANQDIQPQLDLLSHPVLDVAGSENVGGFADRSYNPENGTIKGRPVVFVEYCQTLGDLGDIILWDPRGYATGVRSSGVESAVSMHLYFDYNESAFRFIFSVDGQSWLASAITPANGSNTLSSIVALAARAG